MNKDIIEKAIKEAREKKPGVIIPRDDIYNAVFKAGYDKRESEFVYNPDYLDFDKGVETGRELGVRKVVELMVKDTNDFEVPLSLGCIAKLKVWGAK